MTDVRETADRSLRDKAVEYITQAFSSHAQFYPENLFVVTWNEVGYYENKNDRVCACVSRKITLRIFLEGEVI